MKKLFKTIIKFVIIAIVLLAVLKACFGKDDKPEPKYEEPKVVEKQEDKFDELYRVLVSALEVCRAVAIMIEPFMPNVAKEIANQLNIDINVSWDDILKEDAFKGVETKDPEPIFPRMNLKKQAAPKKEKKVEENNYK